ncbi:unannotated protein [freshwater metagenome]|uniref:Unannotated protein n=1 Tax=freshwater metagenome TaxID=449393 RepID=A0A6J6HRR9_9ZZZZ
MMVTVAMSSSPGKPASAISIKSAALISASRNISQAADQQSARVKESSIFPKCAFKVAIERSSKRTFA